MGAVRVGGGGLKKKYRNRPGVEENRMRSRVDHQAAIQPCFCAGTADAQVEIGVFFIHRICA